MGYYVIEFVSEAYTLQEDTTCEGKISTAGEMVVKVEYLRCIKEKKKCHWDKKQQQQLIIVLTRTIVHQFLDVIVVKYFHDIIRIFFNRKQAIHNLHRHPICLIDSDHDYILD